jgi:LysR family hydrogen peroxide-inducible transcriptional activator
MVQTPSLRQLEYLVAIADLGSFRRAARACGVSQPGLSGQIRQLEALLDLRVLERDQRRVLLTPAGERIVARARAVLAEAQGLVESARALQRPLCGSLRLGVLPTVAPYLLPRVLPRIQRRHPELQLGLVEAPTAGLVAALGRGELDVLVVALESPLAGLATRPLFRDPFHVVLPVGHRLAARRRLREQDLADEPVLLLDDEHCLRAQALSVCRAARARELVDVRAASLATLVEMVRAGAGVTLLPELALRVEASRSGLAVVPSTPPVPHRTLALAWRPTSGRTAEYHLLATDLGDGPAFHAERDRPGRSLPARAKRRTVPD